MPDFLKFTLDPESADFLNALSIGYKSVVSEKNALPPILYQGRVVFVSGSQYLIYDPKVKWLPRSQEYYFISTTQKGRDKFDFNMANQLVLQDSITISGTKISANSVAIKNIIKAIFIDIKHSSPLCHSVSFNLAHSTIMTYQKMNAYAPDEFVLTPTGDDTPIRIYKATGGRLIHIGGIMPLKLNDEALLVD